MSGRIDTIGQPFPNATLLSERMQNLSYLFGQTNGYAAEGSFKALAVEVAVMESKLSAANDRLAALEDDGKRLREAIDPYHQRLLWNFAEGCYMHDMERKDLDALNAALSHEQQEGKG